mmetsp:Transcript_41123/g.131572  ORF Transcript_41123/g.131572 Transcript_41123/m.131572 type:complete len:234 (+) Transcript_41123:124-825(+)
MEITAPLCASTDFSTRPFLPMILKDPSVHEITNTSDPGCARFDPAGNQCMSVKYTSISHTLPCESPDTSHLQMVLSSLQLYASPQAFQPMAATRSESVLLGPELPWPRGALTVSTRFGMAGVVCRPGSEELAPRIQGPKESGLEGGRGLVTRRAARREEEGREAKAFLAAHRQGQRPYAQAGVLVQAPSRQSKAIQAMSNYARIRALLDDILSFKPISPRCPRPAQYRRALPR